MNINFGAQLKLNGPYELSGGPLRGVQYLCEGTEVAILGHEPSRFVGRYELENNKLEFKEEVVEWP